jgi:very-short-patch-repair endonuclease
LGRVARTALEILHFDPVSGADTQVGLGDDRCELACYDCLLSYGNQSDHVSIDRHRVRDLLLRFAGARTLAAGSGTTRVDLAQRLDSAADSSLEREFVKWLADRQHRLPDAAQVLVADAHARPDFVYHLKGGKVAVFVDGPVHDDKTVKERDLAAEDRLMDVGWSVVRIRYDDDWADVVGRYASVFGSGRGVRVMTEERS